MDVAAVISYTDFNIDMMNNNIIIINHKNKISDNTITEN